MTGARNGRLLKILVAIGVLLFCGFLGYHQHATRLELQEAQRRFGDLHRRHDKLANEWKDLLQAHAMTEGELKEERVRRSQLTEAKAGSERDLKEELRVTKERCDSEKSALTSERDSQKLLVHKCEANYNDVVMEHQQLQDKHALEAETAQEQLQKLHTSSQENERQLNIRIADLESDVNGAKANARQMQDHLHECSMQANDLKRLSDVNQDRISVLNRQLKERELDVERLERKLRGFELQVSKPSLAEQGDREGAQARQETAEKPPPSTEPRKLSEAQKRHIYESLRDKLSNGDKLSEKQVEIYHLLRKQYETGYSEEANPRDESHFGGQFSPRAVDGGYGVDDKVVREGVRLPSFPHEEAEVKDLVENPGEREVEDKEELQGGEKFDNLNGRNGEEEEDGGAQPAAQEGQKQDEEDYAYDEEEEEEEEDDNEYYDDEEVDEKIDKENLPQPNLPQLQLPRGQPAGWNGKEVVERPVPVADQKEDYKYDEEPEDDEEEAEEQDEYDYKDEDEDRKEESKPPEDKAREMEEQMRMLNRKDAEGQLQKSVNELDAHHRQETIARLQEELDRHRKLDEV